MWNRAVDDEPRLVHAVLRAAGDVAVPIDADQGGSGDLLEEQAEGVEQELVPGAGDPAPRCGCCRESVPAVQGAKAAGGGEGRSDTAHSPAGNPVRDPIAADADSGAAVIGPSSHTHRPAGIPASGMGLSFTHGGQACAVHSREARRGVRRSAPASQSGSPPAGPATIMTRPPIPPPGRCPIPHVFHPPPPCRALPSRDAPVRERRASCRPPSRCGRCLPGVSLGPGAAGGPGSISSATCSILWLGDDDDAREPHPRIEAALAETVAAGVSIDLVRGNHDFLLGDAFAERTGCRLAGEPLVIEAMGDRGGAPARRYPLHPRRRSTRRFGATHAIRANQRTFLARPMEERAREAAAIRATSNSRSRLKPRGHHGRHR